MHEAGDPQKDLLDFDHGDAVEANGNLIHHIFDCVDKIIQPLLARVKLEPLEAEQANGRTLPRPAPAAAAAFEGIRPSAAETAALLEPPPGVCGTAFLNLGTRGPRPRIHLHKHIISVMRRHDDWRSHQSAICAELDRATDDFPDGTDRPLKWPGNWTVTFEQRPHPVEKKLVEHEKAAKKYGL